MPTVWCSTTPSRDYELISLADFTFGEQAFEANASLDAEGRLVRGDVDVADNAAHSTVPGPADPKPDAFELVYPQAVGVRMGICPFPVRDSYSYSSIAVALHAESEDRAAEALVPMDESGDDAESDGSEMADADVAAVEPAGNPMALARPSTPLASGSSRWVPMRCPLSVPTPGSLVRLTPEQRERFDVALDRWLKSSVRAELLAWPCIRAEVPFFSLGCEDEDIARYGAYAEGAIDAWQPTRRIRRAHWSSTTRRVARRMRRRSSCSRNTPCRRAFTPTFCTRRALRS